MSICLGFRSTADDVLKYSGFYSKISTSCGWIKADLVSVSVGIIHGIWFYNQQDLFTISDLLQRLLSDVPPERPNSAGGSGGEKSIVDMLSKAVAEHSQSGSNIVAGRPAANAKKASATFVKSSPSAKRQHYFSMSVDQPPPPEISCPSAAAHSRAKEAPAEISLAVHQLLQAHTSVLFPFLNVQFNDWFSNRLVQWSLVF